MKIFFELSDPGYLAQKQTKHVFNVLFYTIFSWLKLESVQYTDPGAWVPTIVFIQNTFEINFVQKWKLILLLKQIHYSYAHREPVVQFGYNSYALFAAFLLSSCSINNRISWLSFFLLCSFQPMDRGFAWHLPLYDQCYIEWQFLLNTSAWLEIPSNGLQSLVWQVLRFVYVETDVVPRFSSLVNKFHTESVT